MNFYEFGKQELTSRGMFDNQANEIMQIEIESNDSMDGRWAEDITNYPPMLKNLVWMNIETTALKYIKENCPEAWFRPIFDMEHPLRKEFDSIATK